MDQTSEWSYHADENGGYWVHPNYWCRSRSRKTAGLIRYILVNPEVRANRRGRRAYGITENLATLEAMEALNFAKWKKELEELESEPEG